MKNKLTAVQERSLDRLLARLRTQPLAKEREELGLMMMRHIDSYTQEELKRYEELKCILHNDSTEKND